jgi:hypothetical protein
MPLGGGTLQVRHGCVPVFFRAHAVHQHHAYVCMYVCMYVCIYVCTCVCMLVTSVYLVYAFMLMYVRVLHLCVFLYMIYKNIYKELMVVPLHFFAHMPSISITPVITKIHLCVHSCICTCMHVCIRAHLCMHISMYAFARMYVCIEQERNPPLRPFDKYIHRHILGGVHTPVSSYVLVLLVRTHLTYQHCTVQQQNHLQRLFGTTSRRV